MPLLNLEEAKNLFTAELKARVIAYENRLALPWYARGIEYLKTGLGELGYNRTKEFLTAMVETNTLQELIQLTAERQYQAGEKMRWILCKTVISICGFNDNHVAFVKKNIEADIIKNNNSYSTIELAFATSMTVFSIYEKIIASKDNGQHYLQELNRNLNIEAKYFQMKIMG